MSLGAAWHFYLRSQQWCRFYRRIAWLRGTTSAYSSISALDTSLATSHSVTLTNLAPGVTYHYQVLSKDAAGNLSASADFTFTTVSVPDYWMLTTIKSEPDTRLRFRLKTNGITKTLIASTGSVPLNQWSHAVARYDGSTMKLYLNGVEVGSTAKTGSLSTNANIGVNIGRNPDGYGEWDGRIDDTRIYNKALTPAEIQQLAAQ